MLDLIEKTKKESVEKILENKLGLWSHYIGITKDQEEKLKKKYQNSTNNLLCNPLSINQIKL